MKILGQINITGTDVYQVSSFNPERDHIKGAKKGSYLYVDPLQVYELKGKEEWVPTTFRIMLMNVLSWGPTILEMDESARKEIVDLTFEGIAHFKGGKISKEGENLVKDLKQNYKLVGFVPSATYIMAKERGEGSLGVFWEHPFSIPSLLLKHNKLPLLVISNGNLDFDDSRLLKMARSEKVEVDELADGEYDFEKNEKISGITG